MCIDVLQCPALHVIALLRVPSAMPTGDVVALIEAIDTFLAPLGYTVTVEVHG